MFSGLSILYCAVRKGISAMYQIIKLCEVPPEKIPALHRVIAEYQKIDIPEIDMRTDLEKSDGIKPLMSPIKETENGLGLSYTMKVVILKSVMDKGGSYTVTVKIPMIQVGTTVNYGKIQHRVCVSRCVMDDIYDALDVFPKETTATQV